MARAHIRAPDLIARGVARVRRDMRARRIAAAMADPARSPTILCASIGRVASNMLHRSIVEGRARAILGSFAPSDFDHIGAVQWNLGQTPLRPGSITKTHDFPYALDAVPGLRVVFSFGRPSDTVLSVLRKAQTDGEGWRDRHLRNMHAQGDFADLADRDILRLEEQIDAWRAVTDIPLLAVHYDALWAAAPVLDDFLGFATPLPARKSRGIESLEPGLVARVRHAYARLDAKVARLPHHWRSGD